MVNASSRRRGIPGGAWDTGHPGKNVGLRVLSYRVNGKKKMDLIIIENSVSRGSQGRNGIGWIFSIRYINLSFISLLNSKNRSSDFTNRSSDLADRSFISFLSSKNCSFISFLNLLIFFGKSIIHFLVKTHNFLVKPHHFLAKTPHFLAKTCHLMANLKVKPKDKKGNKSTCKHRSNRQIMLCKKVKNFCHNL